MNMEWLMNPWVIIVIVLSVVIGNLAALKATAHMTFGLYKKKPSSEEKSPADDETIATEQANTAKDEKKDVK